MQWNRKKKLWPYLAMLGCLFLLSVVAPRYWLRMHHHHTAVEHSPTKRRPEIRLAPTPHHDHAVRLQPQRDAASGTPTFSPPNCPPAMPAEATVVTEDDYVLTIDSAGVCLPGLASPINLATASTDPLPAPREFNLDSLLSLRNALRSFVEQAQNTPVQKNELSPAANTTVTATARPKVRVTSETDRLALLPARGPRLARKTAPQPKHTAGVPVDEQTSASAAQTAPTTKTPLLRIRPQTLLVELAKLRELASEMHPGTWGETHPGAWADEVLARLARLTEDPTLAEIDGANIVGELDRLAEQADGEQGRLSDSAVRKRWQQVTLALQRRLPIWRVMLNSRRLGAKTLGAQTGPPVGDGDALLQTLHELASLTAGSPRGPEWRAYLLLDSIAALASGEQADDRDAERLLAQNVLARMADSRLTAEQRQFLATEPLVALHRQLQPWATGPVDLQLLLVLVERYELTQWNGYSQRIAQLQQRLQWSGSSRRRELAAHIDRYYRNANMRIALTDQLLNRMMPKQKPVIAPVRENVAGTAVRGRSRTNTELRIRVLPDPNAWRFDLQAHGDVHSQTYSETWPILFRNIGDMQFKTSKQIVIGRHGLQVAPAKASASGRNSLASVETKFDPVPLLGSLLQNIARNQHRKSRPRALAQVKTKVARTAKQRMDREANPKLQRLEQRFHDSVLAPLEQLALVAEPLDLHTTEQRAVMQLRLANAGQLAAHTPRPLAPSDSLLSVQLHQSAMNNAVAGFGLDGQRLTVGQLFDTLAEKLHRPDAQRPDDLPTRAIVEFASHDAIRIHCDGDRVELILNIKQLARGRDKIRNFKVHAKFRPKVNGLHVTLVRDGTLQFSGRRLLTGPRVVLHSVFGKLLRKDQQVSLLADRVQQDPRLEGLMVTQMTIDNGWIAMALGPIHPDRVAWRTE